jgi:hypothetical protein
VEALNVLVAVVVTAVSASIWLVVKRSDRSVTTKLAQRVKYWEMPR